MRSTSAGLFGFLLASIPSVFADVEFQSPGAGDPVKGGTAFTITWIDSGDAPSITDLSTYQLFLFSGSNTQPVQLLNLANAAFTAGNSATVTVPTTIGGPTTNAYFLGMISEATAGGTITNYSPRFTLTGMTGTFSAAVVASLATVSGTSGPPKVNALAAAVPAAGGAGDANIPYNEQSGTIRYAPMQPVPPTKITATNTDPLYPTSAVQFASTFLPMPTVVTTVTQGQTFSVSSHANTAAAASQPTDDMQKFLNRWKD